LFKDPGSLVRGGAGKQRKKTKRAKSAMQGKKRSFLKNAGYFRKEKKKEGKKEVVGGRTLHSKRRRTLHFLYIWGVQKTLPRA